MQVTLLTDRYAPMAARAAPFEENANWLVVAAACAVLWYGFLLIFTLIYSACCLHPTSAEHDAVIDAFLAGSTPGGVQLNLATFGVYIGILWGVLHVFHGLNLSNLLGPARAALKSFGRVSLILIPLYLVVLGPSLADQQVYQQMDLLAWLAILPLTLPLLFVQIGAEEVVFRGYLQSHMAALTKQPVVWLGLPSVLFGLIHYDGTQPAYSAWAYVIWATGLGLVCADVTARSGTLGPALAIHFVNNFAAMLVLASDDWLFGAALFVWPTYGAPWEPWVIFEALFLFTIWIATRLAIRR